MNQTKTYPPVVEEYDDAVIEAQPVYLPGSAGWLPRGMVKYSSESGAVQRPFEFEDVCLTYEEALDEALRGGRQLIDQLNR